MTPVSYIPRTSPLLTGILVTRAIGAGLPPEQLIAARFVDARLSASRLDAYPGPLPQDLDSAYRCQDAAIALWPDRVAGWKVGWVPEPFASRFGEERLVGPIFARSVRSAGNLQLLEAPVYGSGFAAIEAEFVFRLRADAPGEHVDWTPLQAAELVASLHVGIEIASSPLPTINELGATAIISDFGNNAGLIIGPAIDDWRTRSLEALTCITRIDGKPVGEGGATSLPGGPLAALAFALSRNARRGQPLRAGHLVTTGAATGVHEIRLGQRGEAEFDNIATLACVAVALRATEVREPVGSGA